MAVESALPRHSFEDILEQAAAKLPHGEGLRLIARIDALDANTCTGLSAAEKPAWICSKQGTLKSACLIEYVAQLAALGRIANALQFVEGSSVLPEKTEPRQGAVLRVKSFRLPAEEIAADRVLEIQVQWSDSFGSAYEVSAAVRDAQSAALLAEGSMTMVEF